MGGLTVTDVTCVACLNEKRRDRRNATCLSLSHPLCMGGRGKRKRDAFEVVPAGFAVTGGSHARGRGHGGGRGVHHNTLRQAHAGAMKKSDEIWFRKCGHGERLWSDYYRVAGSPVPLEEWDAFVKVMKTKLPVTFRFRQGADPKERAHLESQLHALGSVAPVP